MKTYKNREEAGKLLAEKLESYKDKDALVLAIPRGGVVTGYEVSKALNLPLDIIVTRKIGYPGNEEYAVGAVDHEGNLHFSEAHLQLLEFHSIAEEIKNQIKEAKRRLELYRGDKALPKIKGKEVILVDDGIATGITMLLAIKNVRKEKPKRIVVAVPVASTEAIDEIRKEVDEIIVLAPPEDFAGAVGSHYIEFEQVNDEEVIGLLKP